MKPTIRSALNCRKHRDAKDTLRKPSIEGETKDSKLGFTAVKDPWLRGRDGQLHPFYDGKKK
jgi:hypothetical protein